jgi:hypothetical protein
MSSGVLIPGRGKIIFTSPKRPYCLGPTQLPNQRATVTLFPGVNRPGRKVDKNAEVKNLWSYTFTPSVCLHGVQIYLYLLSHILLCFDCGTRQIVTTALHPQLDTVTHSTTRMQQTQFQP